MKRWMPYLISAGLLGGLALLVDWSQVGQSLQVRSWSAMALAAVIYVGALVCRALRFHMMLDHFTDDRRVPVGVSFDLATIGTFANHIMPMKTGELVFIFLCSMTHRIPLAKATVTLMCARMYDLVGILMVLVAGMLASGRFHDPRAYAVLGAMGVVLVAATVRMDLALRLGRWAVVGVLRGIGQVQRPRVARFIAFLDQLAPAMRTLQTPRLIVTNTLLSLGVWLCVAGASWQMLHALGFIEWSFAMVIVGSIGAVLSGMLPVSGLGSIGMLEAGWAAGFMAVGMARTDAVATGVAVHLLQIIASGLLAWVSVLRQGRGFVAQLRGFIARQRETVGPS